MKINSPGDKPNIFVAQDSAGSFYESDPGCSWIVPASLTNGPDVYLMDHYENSTVNGKVGLYPQPVDPIDIAQLVAPQRVLMSKPRRRVGRKTVESRSAGGLQPGERMAVPRRGNIGTVRCERREF